MREYLTIFKPQESKIAHWWICG